MADKSVPGLPACAQTEVDFVAGRCVLGQHCWLSGAVLKTARAGLEATVLGKAGFWSGLAVSQTCRNQDQVLLAAVPE